MIDIKDVLTLDDDIKYVVVSKVQYTDGKEYYYLVDMNDNSNIKFGYVDNDDFVETSNTELMKNLLPLFAIKGIEILKEKFID